MPDNRKPLIYGAFPVCRNYTVRAHILDAGNPKRYRPENSRGNSRSRLGGIFAGCLHPCDSRHEKRSRTENQRLHGKRRITTRNEQKRARRPPEMLRQAAKFIFRCFRSEFPFGSGLGQTEKSQNSPSKKVRNMQKNPAEIRRFQPDLVGVSGFEPEASWSRTKRDTKLRHTPSARVL